MAQKDRYKIVRQYRNGDKRTIKRGVTLAEAQKHCRDPKTSKKDEFGVIEWMDGYDDDVR